MKAIFIILFAVTNLQSSSQPLDSVSALYYKNELENAKRGADEIEFANRYQPDFWLLKSRIYLAICIDLSLKDLVAEPRTIAFQSLKKAYQLSTGWVDSTLKREDYQLALEIYKGYTEEGVAFFNAATDNKNKESYRRALVMFKKTLQVGAFIYQNGWGLMPFDTLTICNTALAAIKSGDEQDGFYFAKKLVDSISVASLNILDKALPIMQWLTYYVKSKHLEEELVKYTAYCNRLFPQSTYFKLNYIDWLHQEGKIELAILGYEDLLNKGFNSTEISSAYVNERLAQLGNNNFPKDSNLLIINQLRKDYFKLISKYKNEPANNFWLGKIYRTKALLLRNEIMSSKNLTKLYRKKLDNDLKIALVNSNKHLEIFVHKCDSRKSDYYKQAMGILLSNYQALKNEKGTAECRKMLFLN